jgi:hypothetical protein
MLSMAVCAAQLDESGGSLTVSLDSQPAGGKGPGLLLRRQSSKKLVADKQHPSPTGAAACEPISAAGMEGTAATALPMLSMAVCAAQLDEHGTSPTLTLDADSSSRGNGTSLLLRRQSSRKLVGHALPSPSSEPSQGANDAADMPAPVLSMAVCAAQLDEAGASLTVTLDTASHAANGKGPTLLLRRQSSKKLVVDKQLASPTQKGSV